MSDTITVVGNVATDPSVQLVRGGVTLTSFRLACAQRKYDPSTQKWSESGTNWYSVSAFRHLGENVSASVRKGDRVIVSGRLNLREWSTQDKRGISPDIEAETVGHDLRWGVSQYARTRKSAPTEANVDSFASAEPGGSAPFEAGSTNHSEQWLSPGEDPFAAKAS